MTTAKRRQIESDPLAYLITAVGGKSNPRPAGATDPHIEQLHGTTGGKVIFLRAERYVIRWRKTTATFVIYHGGRVWESGFDTEEQAEQYLQDKFERDEQKAVQP
jgi:hypothetical protein